jgi:hypothetical protein
MPRSGEVESRISIASTRLRPTEGTVTAWLSRRQRSFPDTVRCPGVFGLPAAVAMRRHNRGQSAAINQRRQPMQHGNAVGFFRELSGCQEANCRRRLRRRFGMAPWKGAAASIGKSVWRKEMPATTRHTGTPGRRWLVAANPQPALRSSIRRVPAICYAAPYFTILSGDPALPAGAQQGPGPRLPVI